MNTSYYLETIARQRMDETTRRARSAHQRRQIKTRAGRHFPKVKLPRPPARGDRAAGLKPNRDRPRPSCSDGVDRAVSAGSA